MIQENKVYAEEDDISPEEQARILNEVAREKGYRDYEHLKNRTAKNIGFVNWQDYRTYLFRSGQIQLTARQIKRIFGEEPKEKRAPRRRALGRLIGTSLRGIKTRKIWLKNMLNDPIDFVESLRGTSFRPEEIYNLLGMNRQEYLSMRAQTSI